MSDEQKARDPKGRWLPGQSGNPAGAPRLTARVRSLLAPYTETLIESVIAQAICGDVAALRLCLERICPPLRADSEPTEIPGLAEAKTLVEKTSAVLDAMSRGEVGADTAAQIIAAISSTRRSRSSRSCGSVS